MGHTLPMPLGELGCLASRGKTTPFPCDFCIKIGPNGHHAPKGHTFLVSTMPSSNVHGIPAYAGTKVGSEKR